MTTTREILVNGRWPLFLPPHRAARESWPWWEATRLAAMRTVIGPESVVYDIGAEEGDFPALWASWGAQVVLAEPNPKVWSNIRVVFEANGLQPLATWSGFVGDEVFYPAGSSSVARRAEWQGDPWPESAYGPVIGDHGFCQLGERPDISTTTIDALVDSGITAPTVITMDVEGSEFHVLRGAERTLKEHQPIVFVSVHPEFMLHHYGIENGVEVIGEFMAKNGYEATFLSMDHEHHWVYCPAGSAALRIFRA